VADRGPCRIGGLWRIVDSGWAVEERGLWRIAGCRGSWTVEDRELWRMAESWTVGGWWTVAGREDGRSWRIVDCRLQAVRLWIVDYGGWIVDCGGS
jgi:hypothetical protein